MGSIGIWQVILVLAIVLIIFGAGKLPRVMGDLAKGVKNFKSGMKDAEDEESEESAKAIKSEQAEPAAEAAPAAEKDEVAKG